MIAERHRTDFLIQSYRKNASVSPPSTLITCPVVFASRGLNSPLADEAGHSITFLPRRGA